MATLLMGYDTEFSAIGENLCRAGLLAFYPELPDDTTARGLEIITRNHREYGVGATLFICGRTLVHSLPGIEKAQATGLFDLQQHTYSHVLFKEDRWQGGSFLPSPPAALRHELEASSELIRRHLGIECFGLRTPHGHYKGLADRPDLVGILAETGIKYVSSWGRNSDNGNPTPLAIQPFWYADQGHPDILELPFQHWLDGIWFEEFGRDRGADFLEVLKSGIDEIVQADSVYGVCFHEWAMLLYDEAGTGWVRGMLDYALTRGVEVMSYGDYYKRQETNRS